MAGFNWRDAADATWMETASQLKDTQAGTATGGYPWKKLRFDFEPPTQQKSEAAAEPKTLYVFGEEPSSRQLTPAGPKLVDQPHLTRSLPPPAFPPEPPQKRIR